MRKINELTVFTIGDSSLLKTWSNVPYFLTEALSTKGIKVNRVNLGTSNFKRRAFKYLFYIFWCKVKKDSTFDYRRSYLHFVDVSAQIKKAIKKFPDADANIFLTFSFSSKGLSKKPIVLICDWPYSYFIKHFKDKSPDFFESQSIMRDNLQIEGANLVIVLFKSILPYMEQNYKNRKIRYLDQYVINSFYRVETGEALVSKTDLYNILFVGSNNDLYLEGARNLIIAFREIKKEYPKARLQIVGLKATVFDLLPEGVTCYGYLDKGIKSDNQLFYELFKTARVYVNTNPKWSGLSTTIEAMYFHIPVIVSPYDEFISLFGKEINFGCYCYENSSDKIADAIRVIFNENNYYQLCKNAHDAVKHFTWISYADKLINEIEATLNS